MWHAEGIGIGSAYWAVSGSREGWYITQLRILGAKGMRFMLEITQCVVEATLGRWIVQFWRPRSRLEH